MVEDMNALGVDHVLCTGDITNLALPQEFAFARARFDKLALGPTQVTVVPGNHDAYVAAGIPLFSREFGAFATTDPGWEWTAADGDATDEKIHAPRNANVPASAGALVPMVPHWPIVRVRGEVAIIGLSTSRQTPWFTAFGRLGDAQLRRLDRVLADPRLAGKVRLVAIHHPPAGKRAQSKIRGLRDHAAFADVIGARGAELIVHGHEHRCMTEELRGPAGMIPVRGISSGTYLHNKPERTARYRIYDIENGRLTRDHVRVWERESARFVEREVSVISA
jgi:3',5'-cyclic AMP phosphodiesterase CpdA